MPRDDELGKLIHTAINDYKASASWEEFLATQTAPSDLSSTNIAHPAAHLLSHMRKRGVPVTTKSPAWSLQRRDQAVTRGPHRSAAQHCSFVRKEFADFLRKKFWTILPYRLVRNLQDLRLSPLGVVPQRERRPRLIVDLTFNDINADTVPLAPAEAMQFGRALQRLLQRILDADPRFGPILVAKIDIADGFYRIEYLAAYPPA